jgi:hypothetical protein
MIVITKNSTYEFDDGRYRRIKPKVGEWKTYFGFYEEPIIGSPLNILRDKDRRTITSKVLDIQEDDDDDLEP